MSFTTSSSMMPYTYAQKFIFQRNKEAQQLFDKNFKKYDKALVVAQKIQKQNEEISLQFQINKQNSIEFKNTAITNTSIIQTMQFFLVENKNKEQQLLKKLSSDALITISCVLIISALNLFRKNQPS